MKKTSCIPQTSIENIKTKSARGVGNGGEEEELSTREEEEEFAPKEGDGAGGMLLTGSERIKSREEDLATSGEEGRSCEWLSMEEIWTAGLTLKVEPVTSPKT